MTAATRRLWSYGLLLVLPALAVGALALGLLARERARLAEREAAAREARRAAVETRARLIAENIELLVGDVQAALMTTLQEAPVDDPHVFLSEWKASNPLVREVFHASGDGRPMWGGDATLHAWLGDGAPWAGAGVSVDVATEMMEARGEITSNVGQYQRARQQIQAVAKVRSRAAAAPAAELRAFSSDAYHGEASMAAPARTGWASWKDTAGSHLFGWRELPDRSVIGLELSLDSIRARLGEVFPGSVEAGEAYVLRDANGAVWHQVGTGGLPPVFEVPLAPGILPGWTVLGLSRAAGPPASSAGGIFALGVTLTGLLVLAILAAGGLLVRQARLSELEAERKTSFVANVSHELKTPLTTIRLYAELLAEGRVRDDARRVDYLATIGRETQRLGRLVSNVLDFSRLEQGKKTFDRSRLDLAAELRRLCETHAPRLAAAGLALRLETPDELALETDRDAVGQIVLNLFDNACKYAAEGGEVLVRLAVDETGGGGGRVRLSVADRGPGVPDGQRERIFEKFHRVDDRLTAERAGAGLGLSIARRLARGLGGDLRCEARAGGGADFVFTFPFHP
jgi:Signal transduction histidine kinase